MMDALPARALIRDNARWLRSCFEEFVEAGFTEEQALVICARMAAGSGDA